MKIVCGSCQAKYSIADEKVAGKVFKIRCKRCGEVIVVRGDQDAAAEHANGNGHAAASPAAYEAPADAIWHVVINGEQAGPYAPSQLAELIHAGQLDWDAYVWCEGFENWLPMREVNDLVSAITGQRSGDDVTPAPVTRTVQPAGGAPSMGADPFADEAPPQVQMYAKPVAQAVGQAVGMSAMGGGHGGGAQAATMSAFDASPSAKVVASSPRVSAEQAMTGARNENSVLFSLKNLQALATGSSAPAAPPHGLSNRPGYAGGEGSGLIDIRALATATGVNEQSNRPGSEKDALLSLGSAQAGAFGALGSPMLAPPGRSEDEGGKKGLMFAVLGGVAMLAVAGIAIAMIMKPTASISPTVSPMVPPPTAAAMPAVPPPTAATAQPSGAAVEPPSEGEAQAAQRERERQANLAKANDDEGKRGHGKDGKRGNDREKPAAAEPESRPVAVSKPDPEPKPEKPKHSGNNSIDDLLNDALKPGGKPGAAAATAPAANLQEKPTRDDVLDAMKGVQDAVKACGKGQSGVAFANVTVIGKTGRVSNVEVTGMTGDVGSCIARSVRKASFPKFKADNFQVKFPFRL